jgi:NADH:ubiquinone oxidoreductase subunit 6 (subunit J)
MDFFSHLLHLTLCFLISETCFLVIKSDNAINSVLFLILTFILAASICIFFCLDFFGLVFIIIYVGAIAVLFLFIVMMLNIKNTKLNKSESSFWVNWARNLNLIFFIFSFILSLISYFFFSSFMVEDSFLALISKFTSFFLDNPFFVTSSSILFPIFIKNNLILSIIYYGLFFILIMYLFFYIIYIYKSSPNTDLVKDENLYNHLSQKPPFLNDYKDKEVLGELENTYTKEISEHYKNFKYVNDVPTDLNNVEKSIDLLSNSNIYNENIFNSYLDNLNNTEILGQSLYNEFLACFLLSGLILLIALIGSIVLTLKFNNIKKSQVVSRQLSRTDNFLTYFKLKQ